MGILEVQSCLIGHFWNFFVSRAGGLVPSDVRCLHPLAITCRKCLGCLHPHTFPSRNFWCPNEPNLVENIFFEKTNLVQKLVPIISHHMMSYDGECHHMMAQTHHMMAPTHHMMGVAIILHHMMSYDGWAFFAAILIKLKHSCPGHGKLCPAKGHHQWGKQ